MCVAVCVAETILCALSWLDIPMTHTYGALLSVLSVYRALLGVYMALSSVCRAPLSVYRAFFGVCMALLSVCTALFECVYGWT